MNERLERLIEEMVQKGIRFSDASREFERRFISRAAANPLARPVKVADLKDNLWQAHQAGIEPGRYETGLRLLDELTNH